MNDDAALLHRFAADGSNPAFTELVRRHLDLVYRAALRRTGGDTHRAEDVAQQVFSALARDARKLSRHTVLVAWLHTATRNAALNLMISEQRRQARELAAHALAPAAADAPLDWDQLRPVLDAAIDELPEADRTAVILRYLEQRPFAEVGAALRLSTDAARLRTTRALDKLREVLARRGLTSTAAAVGALVSSQPLVSAPPGLAAALAARALGSRGGATSGAAVSFLNMKFLTAASGLTVTYDSTGRGLSTKPELTPEVMHAKVLQYKIDQADTKVSTMEKKIVPVARQAEAAYRAVHKRYPANPEELLPYFATPQAGADWVEFIEATKAAVAARTAK